MHNTEIAVELWEGDSADPGRKHLHQGYSKDHSLDSEPGWLRGDGLGPVSLEE